jgi:hypothetical protein
VIAMYGRPSCLARAATSPMGSDPSLSVLWTWRSAWGVASQAGSASSSRRTSARVRNPRRVGSGSGTGGASSSHPWIRAATQGPTALSSVSERPARAKSSASSGQYLAARAARWRARRRWAVSSSPARSSSSPRSAFDRTGLGSDVASTDAGYTPRERRRPETERLTDPAVRRTMRAEEACWVTRDDRGSPGSARRRSPPRAPSPSWVSSPPAPRRSASLAHRRSRGRRGPTC